jgi:exosortase/archaeosortase family protein
MSELSAKSSISRQDRASLAWKLGDAEVLLLYSFALFVTAVVQRFLDGNSLDTLFEFNAGEILALCAMYAVVKPKTGVITLSRSDFVVISACALLMLPPVSQHFAFFGAGIAGLYFVFRSPRDAQLAQVGQLWLAISCYESVGRLFFRLVSEPLMQAELLFIAKIGPALGFQFARDGIRLVSPDGWFIYMMERCSAFHNISLAILVWLSLLKIAGAEVHRPQLIALGGAILSIVLLNALRILMMTPSSDAFYFWHDGAGALIFSCVTFFAVALPTALSLRQTA